MFCTVGVGVGNIDTVGCAFGEGGCVGQTKAEGYCEEDEGGVHV